MGGDGLNLIFLPGASGNTAFWQPVIQRLQDDSTMVVAYPSFGGYPDEMKVQSWFGGEVWFHVFLFQDTLSSSGPVL